MWNFQSSVDNLSAVMCLSFSRIVFVQLPTGGLSTVYNVTKCTGAAPSVSWCQIFVRSVGKSFSVGLTHTWDSLLLSTVVRCFDIPVFMSTISSSDALAVVYICYCNASSISTTVHLRAVHFHLLYECWCIIVCTYCTNRWVFYMHSVTDMNTNHV